MTSPSETAADHQMVPEYDQTIPEGPAATPAAVTVTDDDPQPVGSAAHEYRIAPAENGAAEEPDATGETELEIPPAAGAPGTVPESIRDTHAVTDDLSPGVRWHEIQATFVDDPRSCVELAAGVVDDSVEALVASVRERQHALLSGWQRGDAATEELRVALQRYRTFWDRLEDFCRAI